MLGKAVTALSTFIILGIVARSYKEEGTGIFTLALTYLTIFFLLGDFGFNAHILRKGVVDWQKLFGLRIILAVVLIVLSLLIFPSKITLFGSLAILGSAIFVTCNLIFQEKLRYDLSVLSSSIGTLVYLFFVWYFSGFKSSIEYLTLAFAGGWLVIGVSSLFFVRKFLDNIIPDFNIFFAKNLIKDSWPIAATLILNVIYFRVDVFIIAFFKGTGDVGIYNVAYSVFQSALVLPAFIMNAYYPLMLKSLQGLRLVGFGLFALATFGTITTLIFAPAIINILTGGGFLGAFKSLQILSLGFPAYFLSALLMWLLVKQGKYKLMLAVYTSGLIINLILNLIYIPQYSFFAASWITVISEYVILIMQISALKGILLK